MLCKWGLHFYTQNVSKDKTAETGKLYINCSGILATLGKGGNSAGLMRPLLNKPSLLLIVII